MVSWRIEIESGVFVLSISNLILAVFLLTVLQDPIAEPTDCFHLIGDRRVAYVGILLLRRDIRFIVHRRRRIAVGMIRSETQINVCSFLFETWLQDAKNAKELRRLECTRWTRQNPVQPVWEYFVHEWVSVVHDSLSISEPPTGHCHCSLDKRESRWYRLTAKSFA